MMETILHDVNVLILRILMYLVDEIFVCCKARGTWLDILNELIKHLYYWTE